MKRSGFVVALVLIGILVMSLAAISSEGTWFDLEDCSMCKNLTAEKGLLEHMEWETHLIHNGMLSVTVVDPEYTEAFKRAMANMEETGTKLMNGEQMYLCGFCTSYGGLHMAGATMEDVKTDLGLISLITANDSKTIEMIHKHGQRTIDEYAKMVEAEGDHAGHDHSKHAH